MYERDISRRDPGCVVFLLDRSDSMKSTWANSRETLAQGAARVLNEVLLELLFTSQGAPPSRVPVWVEPVHGYRTPMCQAVAVAGAHVYEWASAHPDSFPPIIINITDGMVTDSPYEGASLDEWAQRLVTISEPKEANAPGEWQDGACGGVVGDGTAVPGRARFVVLDGATGAYDPV